MSRNLQSSNLKVSEMTQWSDERELYKTRIGWAHVSFLEVQEPKIMRPKNVLKSSFRSELTVLRSKICYITGQNNQLMLLACVPSTDHIAVKTFNYFLGIYTASVLRRGINTNIIKETVTSEPQDLPTNVMFLRGSFMSLHLEGPSVMGDTNEESV